MILIANTDGKTVHSYFRDSSKGEVLKGEADRVAEGYDPREVYQSTSFRRGTDMHEPDPIPEDAELIWPDPPAEA